MSHLKIISAVVFKETKQLVRDKMTFGMVVMIPIIQLMLFGFAINTKIRDIPVAVVDLNQTSLSRYVIESSQASQIVVVKHYLTSVEQAEALVRQGKIKAILVIPKDLPKRLINRKDFQKMSNPSQFQPELKPIAQWIVDGTDPIIAGAINSLSMMPMANIDIYFRNLNQQSKNFEVVTLYNPNGKSVINIAPGLVGIILTMTMVMFTSAAIVREKEQGNLEFLITTPIKPIELMIGKIIPFIIIGLLQTALILGLSVLIFKVPILGKPLSITFACLIFIFASLTLGLVISTIAQTQLQAMQITIFILLPSILLSGFMFPYEGMPKMAQAIAEILPTTHFMRMIRAITLKSASIQDVKMDAVYLILFGLITLLLASIRFKKRLD